MEYKSSLYQSNKVEIDKDTLSCIVCLELAFDPLVYECCCTIVCNNCYNKVQISLKKCLICRKENVKAKPNTLLKKIISTILLQCPLGCGQVNKYIDMKSHIIQSHRQDAIDKEVLTRLVAEFNIKIFDEKLFLYHAHSLRRILATQGWQCKGKVLFPHKNTCCDEGNLNAKYMYDCFDCDYKICEKCIEIKNVADFSIGSYHQHPLKYIIRDNGWACDGVNMFSDCKSGITGFSQSDGLKRFRCEYCDIDLCEKCLLYALTTKN